MTQHATFNYHLSLIGRIPKYMYYERRSRRWHTVGLVAHNQMISDLLKADPGEFQRLTERYHFVQHLDNFTSGLN